MFFSYNGLQLPIRVKEGKVSGLKIYPSILRLKFNISIEFHRLSTHDILLCNMSEGES